jgi:uncharacterized protein YkwD
MKKIRILILVVTLSLASCVKVSEVTPAPTPALFVTATLPPTKQSLSVPTDTPTSAPEASTTLTPGTLDETAGTTSNATCTDSAVLLEDVTVPDNAKMQPGEKFTKTWRFKNNGKCNWSGYTISFVAGDKMESPASAPVPETATGQTVDVSVELIAPAIDGAYTGYFELKNANGETLAIGIEKTFWVKIRIGNVAAAPVSTLAFTPSSGAVPTVKVSGPASCNYSTSSSYANELANLINSARTQKGLPALTVNSQLTAAAQAHSIDMACHGLISHSGSDGSSVSQRVVAAGYSASRSSEIIYGSGYPQTAFEWWMNDQIHRDEILSPYVTEMGVGYAYVAGTSHGGYYTVDFATP